jgi:hypothetical protein
MTRGDRENGREKEGGGRERRGKEERKKKRGVKHDLRATVKNIPRKCQITNSRLGSSPSRPD